MEDDMRERPLIFFAAGPFDMQTTRPARILHPHCSHTSTPARAYGENLLHPFAACDLLTRRRVRDTRFFGDTHKGTMDTRALLRVLALLTKSVQIFIQLVFDTFVQL